MSHHHYQHHNQHTLHFGTACEPVDANWLVHFVCLFGLYPAWVFVFNFFFIALTSDLYFALMSKIIFLVAVRYTAVIAELVRIERDPATQHYDYRLCHADRYVYPDTPYVTSMIYTLTIIYAFWSDTAFRRRHLTWWNRVLFGGVIALYVASTIVSGYFTWAQLLINSAIVVGTSVLIVLVYRYSIVLYTSEAAHNPNNVGVRLLRLLGLSVALFVPQRLASTDRQQQRQRRGGTSQIFTPPRGL